MNKGLEALNYIISNERFSEPVCQEDQDKRKEIIKTLEKELKKLDKIKEALEKSYLMYGWLPKDTIKEILNEN